MGVAEDIKKSAGDLEMLPNWKSRIGSLKHVGYDYVSGEARRYYSNGNGRYYYRRVSEAEMHRYK